MAAFRIAVTGTEGQVARSLIERGAAAQVDIVALGRPQLDLAAPQTIHRALEAARPDAIVSAAAYTAVDQAESEREAAFAVNAEGAGHVARAARDLGVPLLHLSTDYVFDGALDRPYLEDDAPCPTGVYGASKLAGEEAVLAAGGVAAVMRTAWVYSPFGRNFARTMVRLGSERDEVRVVADQIGCPTSALDIADALIAAARRLAAAPTDASLNGIFHLAGSQAASWQEFAQGIFDALAARTSSRCAALPISTSEYPTPARRPANSRLDGGKLARAYGLEIPGWPEALPPVIDRILADLSS